AIDHAPEIDLEGALPLRIAIPAAGAPADARVVHQHDDAAEALGDLPLQVFHLCQCRYIGSYGQHPVSTVLTQQRQLIAGTLQWLVVDIRNADSQPHFGRRLRSGETDGAGAAGNYGDVARAECGVK